MMNPGKWIIVAFISFAAFIGTLVFVCVREDVSLVSTQYYQDELKFNQQQSNQQRANLLAEPPEIQLSEGKVEVLFATSVAGGTLQIQRPSDIRLDYQFELDTNIRQHFEMTRWEPGLYRLKLSWSAEGKEYQIERSFVL
jgi:hypothetical protein